MSKALHIRALLGMPELLMSRSEAFPFPPQGNWSDLYATRFDEAFRSRFNPLGSRLQKDIVPVARYAWLVRSLSNLPRGGAWQDEKLCGWAAGLVQAVVDANPRLAEAKALWTYPTGLHANMLRTLVAMQMYFPPSLLSPLACRSLLTALDKDLLREPHAALRQDGHAHCLLWLAALQTRASEDDATTRLEALALDSLLGEPPSIERLMEYQASDNARGAQARKLMSRLAERVDENADLDFLKGKSSPKLSDEAWMSRPTRQLAHQVAKQSNARITTAHLETTLQDIARVTRRPMAEVVSDFSKHFCLAIADCSATSQWHNTSTLLVGPPLRPTAPPVLSDVFDLLKRHAALDADFAAQLRHAFFEVSKPDFFAGQIVMARLTALDMELRVAGAPVADTAPEVAPRHRRLGL